MKRGCKRVVGWENGELWFLEVLRDRLNLKEEKGKKKEQKERKKT